MLRYCSREIKLLDAVNISALKGAWNPGSFLYITSLVNLEAYILSNFLYVTGKDKGITGCPTESNSRAFLTLILESSSWTISWKYFVSFLISSCILPTLSVRILPVSSIAPNSYATLIASSWIVDETIVLNSFANS